jgi:hypothetical protein
VGDDVAHSAHAAEGQLGKEGLGFRRKPVGRFANDFETTEHGILFLRILHERIIVHLIEISPDQFRRIEDIA